VPAGQITGLEGPRGFAGVDEDVSFRVFDQPRVDRQPISPLSVKQHPQRAAGTARRLRWTQPGETGLNRMYSDHLTSSHSIVSKTG
jgi:hypothetical protein